MLSIIVSNLAGIAILKIASGPLYFLILSLVYLVVAFAYGFLPMPRQQSVAEQLESFT